MSFVGLGALSLLHYHGLADSGWSLMIGSFGASTVLLSAAPQVRALLRAAPSDCMRGKAPFSQPRNVIGGHLISSAVSVGVAMAGLPVAVAVPAAVSLSIMAMVKSLFVFRDVQL